MRLQDKVAIITGAGAGLGLGIAELFAAEGAKIVIAERDEEKGRAAEASILKNKGIALFCRTDTRQERDIAQMVESTVSAFGEPDILVNNAGIGLVKKIPEIDTAEWDNLHAVNLRGYFLCAKHVIPRMQKQGRGSIINIASNLAYTPLKKFAAYAAAKGGIISLTRGLALDHGEEYIRVNAICPGMVMTATTEEVLKATGDYEKMVSGTLALQCIPRIGEEKDIAGLALFLATEGSSFITGQAIIVDGGAGVGLDPMK